MRHIQIHLLCGQLELFSNIAFFGLSETIKSVFTLLTSLIADLSISTGDTVKAAGRLPFPIGSSGSWGAALTAYRNRHLNN